jgi:hypothetical protein
LHPDKRGRHLSPARAACYIGAMRYILLAGLIAGALLGYYVLWSHLADQLAAQADAWIEAQRRQGRDAAYDSRRLWGFPYRLSLTLQQPRWHDPQNPAGWRLQADTVTAHVQLWDMHHVIFDLSGRQTIGWRHGTAEHQIVMQNEKSRASLVLDGAGNWLRIAADLTKAQMSGATVQGEWRAERLLLHARRAGTLPPAADLALQADGVTLPPAADGPLGRDLSQVRLVGTLRGAAFGRTPEDLLGTWRESGGVVDFQTISLHWGALRLDGDGSLSLDRQLRPLGAMSGRITGIEPALDALVASGRMRGQDAAFAKTAAALLARRDDKGGSYIPAQISAQDGKLSLGPVPLLSLSPVLPAPPQP